MMLPILEKYFLAHGQLVLPGIGQLNLSQTDSIHSNGLFQPPVHQIIFDAMIEPTTKPSKLFYIYLSDFLLFLQSFYFSCSPVVNVIQKFQLDTPFQHAESVFDYFVRLFSI